MVKKCSLLGCDYTFIDEWSHHWQFHSEVINPVEPIRVASTIKRYQNDPTSNEIDDVTTSEAESEKIHVIHSDLKLQDSNDKAPEQGTDVELTPALEYRPKVNPEDNDELTKVINNEHLHAEKPVLN